MINEISLWQAVMMQVVLDALKHTISEERELARKYIVEDQDFMKLRQWGI